MIPYGASGLGWHRRMLVNECGVLTKLNAISSLQRQKYIQNIAASMI